MQSVVEAKQKLWLLELLTQGAGGAGGAETAGAQSTLRGLTTGSYIDDPLEETKAFLYLNGFRNGVPRLATAGSPGNLLDMHILQSLPGSPESEILGGGPGTVFYQPFWAF